MLYLCLWEAAKLYDWYFWINYLGSNPGSTIFWLCLNRCLSHLNFNFLICRMGIITAYDPSGCYNELVINESTLNNVYRRHSNISFCFQYFVHYNYEVGTIPSLYTRLLGQKVYIIMFQFSSVTQSCPTLCNPMNRSTPGLPVHHQLLESTQIHVHCNNV